jgi:hypothetical protein
VTYVGGMGPLVRAVGFVLAGAVSSFAAPTPRPTFETCPPGAADGTRAATVRALLARAPDGVRLLRARAIPLTVCFVAGEGGLTPGHAALLDRSASLVAQAARLGHLAQHAADGAPAAAPAPGEACDAWRARTAAAEARGDEVEARVARALGEEPRLAERTIRDAAYDDRCR